MDFELRIVVEKVAVSSQEVVQRDTITSYAVQCPTSIVELGLRHGEQIALLEKIQDRLLTEQSALIDHEMHGCPHCGDPLKKNGYKASDFHAVFSDHTVNKAPYGRTLRTSALSSGTGSLRACSVRAPFDHLPLIVDHPIGRVPDAPHLHLTLTVGTPEGIAPRALLVSLPVGQPGDDLDRPLTTPSPRSRAA